jgi:hypothetical protein
MNIEEILSSGSRSESISMAIEIIEIEIYAQMLSVGLDPDSIDIGIQMPEDNFDNERNNSVVQSEWLAYTSLPRLINRRLRMVAKLEEINNA